MELTVNPNATFKGKVEVGGDVSIGGELKLNSKFTATSAALAKLEAGPTVMTQLDVNGDGTFTNLITRNDLTVNGQTKLQGAVTLSQLLTVNNSVNVSGSLTVGGTLLVNQLHISALQIDNSITLGGHVITKGSAPGVSPGTTALGNNGTVSISGNDIAGTIGVNIGTGATSGLLASVTFVQKYAATPHVVVTAIGGPVSGLYINRTSSGFSVYTTGGLSPGGYAIDYIVSQ